MFGYMFVDIIEKFPARGRTLLGILSGNKSVVGLLLVSITILASTVSVEQFHRKSNEEKDATGKYHL